MIWGVSRNTTDAMSGSGSRFTRGGVNETGVNGSTTAAADGTSNGFTFGRLAYTANFLTGFVYEVVIVNFTGTAQMTFAQGQAIAAQLMANWEIPPIDTNIINAGDSRIAGNTVATLFPSYQIGPRATYPDGPLPKNVRIVTSGAGGSTLSTAQWFRDTSQLFSTYLLKGPVDKNIVTLFWSHNDMGAGADTATLYPGTSANTPERVDAILAKLVALIGTDANCFASTFDEVWAWAPLASAISTTLLNRLRYDGAQAVATSAFRIACENGDPSRVIRCFDMTQLSLDNVELVVKATGAHVAYENGVEPFDAYVDINDKRNVGGSATQVYAPPLYADQTHPSWGGTPHIAKALGDFYNATR